MTKATLCITCTDIISPYRNWETDRRWRWCQCSETGVRWRDGRQGLLEVTALHGPNHVRVIGLNNWFLQAAVSTNPHSPTGNRTFEQWRALHGVSCEAVEPSYLFHKDKRNCWALVIRVGESSDVFFIDYPTATSEAPA